MILQIDNLKVVYGRQTALDAVTLQVDKGATGLLGPNGAGKSTLIKTLLGFLTPVEGTTSLYGHSAAANPLEVRRRVGYMPENDCHIPGMNAVTFVAYAGELCGMKKADAMQRAHEVLYYVGLGEARYRNLETYSTGMKQRIKLAQALIHDPDLLLLDEPTNGLDPKGREEMLDLVKDVSARKDISILLCSHLLWDVERICSRVIVLNQGRVVTHGDIDKLRQRGERLFELRIKGDRERFLSVLAREGCREMPGRDEFFRVAMKDGQDSSFLFRMAREAGVQVRHIVPVEHTLEDIFMRTIEGGEHADL
jgi:ABC-2 type transport system ATP-binding protein